MKRITRSEAHEKFKGLPQNYWVQEDMKKDINEIFDYVEHIEETNEILERTLKQATDAVLERNEALEAHKRVKPHKKFKIKLCREAIKHE